MAHDSTKVVLGNVAHTFKHVVSRKGSIVAGLLVHIKSDETLSLLKADGVAHGISLGQDLSNTGRTAIVMAGHEVPILLTAAFTPVIGAQVFVSDTTGRAIASGAGATGINARYLTGPKTSIAESLNGAAAVETANDCALISMPGGV